MAVKIPHSRPWLLDSDVAALAAVLRTGMIAQGAETRRFEEALAHWVRTEQPGVAVASGSAAIVLALTALKAGPGTEVIVPSYICQKVLEAICTIGATPVLCDIGPRWMVEPRNVAALVGPRTRAIVIPHLYGIFVDIASFKDLGVPIIEDCAQAIWYQGTRPLIGDVAIFSFHPTKLITTGEGGMAISNRADLVNAMRALRDGSRNGNTGRLFSPMSDIASALGLSQLSRLDEALERRGALAARYRAALESILPESFVNYPWGSSTYFRFPVQVKGGVGLFQPLFAAQGIKVSNGVDVLLHRLTGRPDSEFPVSVKLFDTTVSLPIYPALNDEDHKACVSAAVQIFQSQPARLTRLG